MQPFAPGHLGVNIILRDKPPQIFEDLHPLLLLAARIELCLRRPGGIGGLIAQDDRDTHAMWGNFWKARGVWVQILKVIRPENASPRL